MDKRGREAIFTLTLLLVVLFAFFVVFNLGSFVVSGKSIFNLPVQGFEVKLPEAGRYTLNENSIVTAKVGNVDRKLKFNTKNNKIIASIDGLDSYFELGKPVTFKLKDGRSVEIKVESSKKGSAVVIIKDVTVNKQSVIPVQTNVKIEPITQKESFVSTISNIFSKFGFGKNTVNLQMYGNDGKNKKLPKEPKVPKIPFVERNIDYPLYNLDIQNKIITTKEQDILLNILKKRGQTYLLSTTEYGLLVTMGLCNNNKWNTEIGESDIDCGGSCQPCDDYKVCNDFYDCKSKKCQKKISGVRREYTGVCIPSSVPVCRETDTGVEVTDIGSVPNRCVDFDTYVKVSCLGPNIKTYVESDPIDCPTNTFCQNGACVPNGRYCNDNDRINDPKVVGIAFDPQNTNRQLGKDYCETSVNLQQVNCKGAGVDYSPGVCPDDEVCKDGACLDACDENDKENNNYLLGIAKDGSEIELGRDSCASEKRLKQVNCVGRNVKFSENDCLPGEFCQDGVCASLCREDDELDDTYYLGTATDQVGRELGKDFCVNDWELKQVKCLNGKAEYSEPKTCEYTEVCSSGVCISRDVCKEPGPDDPPIEGETVFPAVAGSEVKRHIDSCIVEGGKKVKHVVCRQDTPSVSITECPDPTVCNKGLCGRREQHCTDYDWGAIDKNGQPNWNSCGSPTVKLMANCFTDGNVYYFPEVCLDGGICRWPGLCVKNKCEDSDGMDPNTVGKVEESTTIVETGTQQDNLYFDECRISVDYYNNKIDLSKNYVWERGCTGDINDLNGEPNRREYYESLACDQDRHCENSYDPDGNWIGASCVEGEKTYECHDSDGNDPSTAGVVTTDRDPGSEWRDGCTSDNRGLFEYVCKPNGYVSDHYVECGKYCDWGKCSKGIDTDPNSDPFTPGVVTDVNGAIHPDICKNENTVLEYSYNPDTGEATETEIPCPENSKCENGACIRPPDPETFGTCCNKENNEQVFSKPISKEDCYNLGYNNNVGVYFAYSTSDDACSQTEQTPSF